MCLVYYQHYTFWDITPNLTHFFLFEKNHISVFHFIKRCESNKSQKCRLIYFSTFLSKLFGNITRSKYRLLSYSVTTLPSPTTFKYNSHWRHCVGMTVSSELTKRICCGLCSQLSVAPAAYWRHKTDRDRQPERAREPHIWTATES